MADDDGRWLSKAELAAARGISAASTDRLIRRQHWRRQMGDDRKIRVFVPATWIGEDLRPGPRSGNPSGNPTDAAGPTDISRAISVLETAATALREQLERSDARAADAEARERQTRDRLVVALAELATLRTPVIRARTRDGGEAVSAAISQVAPVAALAAARWAWRRLRRR